jgi:hypothetical protein
MIRKTVRWSLLFFMLAGLPVLACNLVTGEGETPAVDEPATDSTDGSEGLPTTAAPAPTAPVGSEEPAGGEAPPLPQFGVLSDALARFNSYRTEVVMRFEPGGDSGQPGTMTMTTAQVQDPPASSVEINVSGSFAEDMQELGDQATLSFIDVAGTTYSVIPGIGCISGAGTEDVMGQFGDALDANDFLSEVEGADYVGEETVNGIATYHYRFDENDINQSDNQLSELNGDVFVSQEDQYVVRMVFDGVGQLDLAGANDGKGNIHFEFNVLDVGEPITIEPPADCDASGSDFPVMEGAEGLATFAGITTYSVNASLEDVVAFYQQEMEARR